VNRVSSDERPSRNASGLDSIGVAISKNVRVAIGSDVADLIGALNDSATIQVQGSAGKYAADGMTGGEVIVNGDADDGAGTAMCGGTLVIKGNAKNQVGHLLKGGTIIVEGNVKHYAGSFMIAGTIIIGGDAGRDIGSSMIGGTIYIQGKHEELSANLLETELAEEEAKALQEVFSEHKLELDSRKFRKIVTRANTMLIVQESASTEAAEDIDEVTIDRGGHRGFPTDVLNSNLISTLLDIQAECGFVPEEKIGDIAQKLGIPLVDTYGVATFYKSFSLAPRGRHSITVCLGTACHVRGGPRVLQRVSEILQIEPGETTKDQQFSLEAVNCLGCCALGPMVVVDGNHHGLMNSVKVDALLRNYRNASQATRTGRQLAPVQVQGQLVN
jgi:NADH:ubiquinone oxidoreductase subunit E/formylmethanofuran dehydrogenase subunit C